MASTNRASSHPPVPYIANPLPTSIPKWDVVDTAFAAVIVLLLVSLCVFLRIWFSQP